MSRWGVSLFVSFCTLAACAEFGTSPDAFKPIEAGTVEAGAEAGTGCAGSAHTFCDDFDHGNLGDTWNASNAAPPVTMMLDTSKSVSAPSSVAFVFPGLASSFQPGAKLTWAYLKPTKSVACRVTVNIAKRPSAGDPSLLHLTMKPASGSFTAFDAEVTVNDTYMKLATTRDAVRTYPTGASLPVGKWIELGLSLDLDTRDMIVSVDGGTNIKYTYPAGPTANEGFEINLGFHAIGVDTTETRLNYDDFSCDVN